MTTKYFKNVDNVEDLKKMYFNLAKKFHSDVGGSDDVMIEINNEYEELFKILKNIHKNTKENAKEKTYKSEQKTREEAGDFIGIVTKLLKLDVDVELCGRWLWIGGNTKVVKDELKAFGCRYSSKKQIWYWHYPEDSIRYHKKSIDMNEIRAKYGSVSFGKNDNIAIAGI